MEQKYKRLQDVAEKSKENAREHEHKARKMTKGYTKVKGENENLYIANKSYGYRSKTPKWGVSLAPNVEKGRFPKESRIIGEHE